MPHLFYRALPPAMLVIWVVASYAFFAGLGGLL